MNRVKQITALLCLFMVSNTLFSQAEYRFLNRADKAFYEYNFKKALKNYQKSYELDTSAHVLRGIAQSYAYLQDMQNSAKYFKKLVDLPNPLPFDILEYAQSLKRVGDYDEAIIWFEKYREIYPLDLRARNHSVNSYHYQKLARNKKNPLFFALDVNDENSVMGYTIFEDKIIFSMSANNGSSDFMDSPEIYLDMFVAEITEEKEFDRLKYLPFHLNSDLHDGPSSYNSITKTLAFTRNASFTKETKEKGVQLEVMFSEYKEGKWEEAVPFQYNSKTHSVGHPTISPDGNKLYFISNKPGGFGGTDIYVCTKLGSEWSEPENLGPEVNTESDEMFPFVMEGDILYFSSEGHAGLGGMDVFKTYPFEDYWAKPENMGAPINSRANDFSFSMISKSQAYFSSDRIGGKGGDDVYFIDIEGTKKFFTIPSKLIESENVSPISVVNLKTGEEKFVKKGESAFLNLDVSLGGYEVAWLHQGEERKIHISGETDETGQLEIAFEGLDGLEAEDFLAQVNEIGMESPSEVKIDQKVWTYEPLDAETAYQQFLNEDMDYAMGKDNVIMLDEKGNEIPNETYPLPEEIKGKEIFYLKENQANTTEDYKDKLDGFVSEYKDGNDEYVSIKLMRTENLSPMEMEEFGEQIETFLIESGIKAEKIQLEWIEASAEVSTSELNSDFEIFITVNRQFSFVD